MNIEMLGRRDDPDEPLDCPAGTKEFRCKGSHYRGCCSVDPCKKGICLDPSGSDANSGPSTVASLGAPLEATGTGNISRSTTTVTSFVEEPSSSIPSAQISPSLSITSLPTFSLSSGSQTTVNPTDSTMPTSTGDASQSGDDETGLSPAAMGGIFGAVSIAFIAAIVAYFLCGKRGKRLRSSVSLGRRKNDVDDFNGQEGLRPYTRTPPRSNHDAGVGNILPSFGAHLPDFPESSQLASGNSLGGGRYEEPQSRFTRASAFTSNTMKNHPINPPFRGPAARDLDLSAATRPMQAMAGIPRGAPATPECHGAPERVAIAELAAPGIPKIVQIPERGPNTRRYKAYRPDVQMHPRWEGVASRPRGDLAATPDERSRNTYVNGWSRWDPET